MTAEHRADPILKGRNADPAIQEGIALVEYPEYLIAEALSGDGLKEAHSRIGAEALTAEAAASAITEMIVERLTDDIPDAAVVPEPLPGRAKASPFIPHFPKPVISKFFGKRGGVTAKEPVFEDKPPRMNFDSPLKTSLLMRAEAVTQQWRQGKIGDDRAAHLLENLVVNYRKRQQER